MANTVTTANQIKYEISLKTQGGDTANRTITFETLRENSAQLAADVKAFALLLYGGPYDWAIQPTGWRDSDSSEEAYQVDNIVSKIIQTTTTTIDTGI